MIRQILAWIPAALGALLLALSFGFAFPDTNQNTYLVHGLVLHDPTLLPHDWYAREATDYHHMFSLLVAALFTLRNGPEPFVVLGVFFVIVGGAAWFALCRCLFGSWVGAVAYLAWLGLGVLTASSDVMGSYLFAGYLQPSSIGTAGYLWSLALFADALNRSERRARLRSFVGSGAALAVASVFHLNFLVLGVATLGMAHLALHGGRVWRRELWISVMAQMALPTIVFLWALPQLLEATRGPTAEALPILFDIRTPHHFRPTLAQLAPFFAWQAAAWLVVAVSRRSDRAVPVALVHLLAGVGGFVIIASLLSTVVQVPQVTQVFPWRVAPVGTGLALLVLVGAALRSVVPEPHFVEPRTTLMRAGVLIVGVALGVYGGAVAWSHADRGRMYLGVLALALVAAVLAGRIASARGRAALAPHVAAGLVGLVAAGAMLVALRDVTWELRGLPRGRQAVATWAARYAPKDAVFAVPPDFESFRLVARRAVVVDWKSSGILPSDVVAWAKRIEEVSGRPLRNRRGVRSGYARMDLARAHRLVELYGVSHFVFDKKSAPIPKWGTVLYQNGRYVVLALPDAQPPNEN